MTSTAAEVIAGRYYLLDKIGQGGAAEVFKAMDTRLGRMVALKLLRTAHAADPTFTRRFENEARAVARLSHRNIVDIYDYDRADGQYFIAMEYVAGPNLHEYLRGRKPLPEREVVTLAADILEGLGAAHESGLIHRDVKPQNVLVSSGGDLKLSDFGLARVVGDAGVTVAGFAFGTPHYISPEQARGDELTPRSDLYSVGVMLYEMLSGRLPFDGSNPARIAHAHILEQAGPVRELAPDVSPRLAAAVERAMAKDPADRFADAREMVDALGAPGSPALRAAPVAADGAEGEPGAPTIAMPLAASAPVHVPATRIAPRVAASTPAHRTAALDEGRCRVGLWPVEWSGYRYALVLLLPLLLLGAGYLLLRGSVPAAPVGAFLGGATSTAGAVGFPAVSPTTTDRPAAAAPTVAPDPTDAPARPVLLRWRPVPGATEYVVERSVVARGWARVGGTGVSGTTYSDAAVETGRRYRYRIAAHLYDGAIEYTTAVEGRPGQGLTLAFPPQPAVARLATPRGFTVSLGQGQSAKLSWEDTNGETSYVVERSTAQRGWRVIATLPGNTTTYLDKGVSFGETYRYRVRSANADTASPPSPMRPITPLPPTPTPTATPAPTWTPTPYPTWTPTPRPTWTPTPRPRNTATPRPGNAPTPTATPKGEPGWGWTPTKTPTPRPSATSTPRPEPTTAPKPTQTPRPTATPADAGDEPEPEVPRRSS